MFGLQQGSTVLKELNKEMSLESVEKIMDDTAEGIAYQEVRPSFLVLCYSKLTMQEVSRLLASRVTNEEEEEVLEEYEALHREALGLPEVPIHSLPRKEPGVEEHTQVPLQEEREEERQAVLA